ncbi:MAG: class I SAM-dependent methyltransferase [Lachnospiraceae bacterium]|nr:class I SAM-dependent methyltransferase [Lachnospiraceae bacterium]
MPKPFTPKLSPRLEGIVSMVPECEKVADIGCDHGYISVALVQRGIARSAIACDIKAGPLEFAKKNIAKAGLEGIAYVRLAPGLNALGESEADCIVIAGMGMRTIAGILTEDMDKAKNADYLVLQPQSEIPEMRQFLGENGFYIIENKLMIEEDKYYFSMLVSSKNRPANGTVKKLVTGLKEEAYGPEFSSFASTLDMYFGLDLIIEDKNMARYLNHVINEWTVSHEKLSEAKKPDFAKQAELTKKKQLAELALELNTLF